jgi:3'-phosphoadenosine 5'-phosphosulfate sulfotransferase
MGIALRFKTYLKLLVTRLKVRNVRQDEVCVHCVDDDYQSRERFNATYIPTRKVKRSSKKRYNFRLMPTIYE